MDPLWAAVTEMWWVGPAVLGGGTVAWIGLRQSRTSRARRLALEAAKLRLAEARRRQIAARMSVKVKRAELTRVQAEQNASRATAAEVAAARRDLSSAQREVKVATADVRAQRAQVGAARALLPQSTQQLPLERLVAEHDALTARWLEYETDPARLIAFPALTDMRVPETSVFVAAQQHALSLRPPSEKKRVTPAEFAAYRDAVSHAARTFEIAERAAWLSAEGRPPTDMNDGGPPPWTTVAESVIRRSAEALGRAADSAFSSMRDAADATREAMAEARDDSDADHRHAGPGDGYGPGYGPGPHYRGPTYQRETPGGRPPPAEGSPPAGRDAATPPSANEGEAGASHDARASETEPKAPASTPRPAPQPVWPVPSRTSRPH